MATDGFTPGEHLHHRGRHHRGCDAKSLDGFADLLRIKGFREREGLRTTPGEINQANNLRTLAGLRILGTALLEAPLAGMEWLRPLELPRSMS